MSQKRCSKCGKWLEANETFFHKNKHAKDGLQNNCKSCQKAMVASSVSRKKDFIKERTILDTRMRAGKIKLSTYQKRVKDLMDKYAINPRRMRSIA